MEKKRDTQSRKWLITINNPVEKGLTHDKIEEILAGFKGLIYWCMSDEIGGKTQTYHTHLYLQTTNGLRFSTLAKRFPNCHFDMAKGTAEANRNYIFKEGEKHAKKVDTNLPDTHKEFGELPVERQGQRNDLADLYDQIKQGMTDFEIISENPDFMFDIDKINRARMVIKMEEYRKKWRDVQVTYLYGDTGAGKTRGVMEQYDYDVYRVTDYKHPFDAYEGQDVIMFEEFRSDVKIGDMLNYLDGYPLQLPSRYTNRVACFTKVYILSNIALKEQYANIQHSSPETFKALCRRINEVHLYEDGDIIKMSTEDYLNIDNMKRFRTDSEILNLINLSLYESKKENAANVLYGEK